MDKKKDNESSSKNKIMDVPFDKFIGIKRNKSEKSKSRMNESSNSNTNEFNKTISELRDNIAKVDNQILAAEHHNTVNKLICCLDLFKAKSKDDDKSKNSSFLPSCFSLKQIDTSTANNRNSYSFGGIKALNLDNKEKSSTEIQLNSANNASLNNNLNNVMNEMSNTTSNGAPNNTARSATQKNQEQQC